MNEKQIAAVRQALIEEAALQAMDHPSKDAQFFAKSVYEFLTAALADHALDKMAENERELGIQMQPTGKQHLQVEQPAIKQGWDVDTLLDKPKQPAQQELDELTAQRDQLADILTRTANALKGEPAELTQHSWHDLPEVAQKLKVAQQEPVAWRLKDVDASEHYGKEIYVYYGRADFKNGSDPCEFFDGLEPLYTRPPARERVGLTDEERVEILRANGEAAVLYLTEAKLKEKNS